jgi:hypothetical protein
MWLDVNGEKRQRGNTRTMIFGCATLVSYVSQFMTLLPGDIITTGTPPGVALGMKPPVWLKAGHRDPRHPGLGEQRQRVLAFRGSNDRQPFATDLKVPSQQETDMRKWLITVILASGAAWAQAPAKAPQVALKATTPSPISPTASR